MLKTSPSTPGLLFLSFLYRPDLITPEQLKKRTEDLFGVCFSFVPRFNPLADFYSKEMGPGLTRIFLAPTMLQPRESLLMAKLLGMQWENEWSKDGKRFVNLDLGFLTLENFILATTKSYSHRIYLAQGIYADLTYQFCDGKFQTLPWTYPDYKDEEKLEYFTWLRSLLLEKIQSDA